MAAPEMYSTKTSKYLCSSKIPVSSNSYSSSSSDRRPFVSTRSRIVVFSLHSIEPCAHVAVGHLEAAVADQFDEETRVARLHQIEVAARGKLFQTKLANRL